MYSVITTPGFVIDSRAYGEAGKLHSIFTRDRGLVLAVAQGIRLEKSKLRYFSQDYSLGIFSMVRGKEFWKLTGAKKFQNTETFISKNRGLRNECFCVLKLIARLASILKRFLQGEDPHEELFLNVESMLVFLANAEGLSDERLRTAESISVFRILHLLGYIGSEPLFPKELYAADMSIELIDKMALQRTLLNKHINKALRESHL